MKFLRKILPAVTTLAVAGGLFFGFSGVANAACQFQYSATNFQTSTTPVFNSICGVPTQFNSTSGAYAFGDETDFVRIRPDTSGDVTSNKNNPKLVGDTLTSACTDGSKYDILTYIHNDASQDFNNNGSGSAVAHNVKLAMTANGIGTTGDNFKFTSAITADAPAVGATDSAVLDCNGHQVKLTLVPRSVHYNTSFDTSTNWTAIGDNAVNGTTAIGSPNWGSGIQWGCWDYLTAVVYQVTVSEIPQKPQVTATCDLFTIAAADDRTVKVTGFKYTAKNTTFKDAVIQWDAKNNPGLKTPAITDASKVVGQTNQYGADGTYLVQAIVDFTNPDSTVTDTNHCAVEVTFSSQPPKVTPPPSTPPKQLVNTGAGSVVGLFAAAAAAGSVFYRWMLGRKLTNS